MTGFQQALLLDTPQYFFDDTWIDRQQRLTRRWLSATIYPHPVLQPDQPWEGRMVTLFGTVLQYEGGYRMYYSCFTPEREPARLLLAESEDGFSWTKPELDVARWRDGRKTNSLLAPSHILDSPSIVFDAKDDIPYKMLGFHAPTPSVDWAADWGLYGYGSQDGVHWEPVGQLLRAGDRSNLMTDKQNGEYVIYTRHPAVQEQCGGRAVYRSSSPDFQNWSEPELVLAPDLIDEPDVEIYGMSVFRRHGWFFGLVEYWHADTDLLEIHLAFSRDGKKWMRPAQRQPFIASTYVWNRLWNSAASNAPIIVNEQMLFYFGGRWTAHGYDSAQQFGAIGYASLPLDRFCALEAGRDGLLVTPPFVWPGGDLVLNADTRRSFHSHPGYCGGQIAVEVLDENGIALPGWSGEKRAVSIGNTHKRCKIDLGKVVWPVGRSLDECRGRKLRLKFSMSDARLFTIGASTAEVSTIQATNESGVAG